eukprot:gene10116-21077_t
MDQPICHKPAFAVHAPIDQRSLRLADYRVNSYLSSLCIGKYDQLRFFSVTSKGRGMNFKHLHYFWVAAKAGGIARAGEQLHTTPQTLSEQIKLLESSLGLELFRKVGRQLELTRDGRLAFAYA